MSKQQPLRPGAPRRPTAGGPPSAAGRQGAGMTIEELNALPEFVEDGENAEVDPANASSGLINDEIVTITKAEFKKFVYNGRDDLAPETRLFIYIQRDGADGEEEKLWEETYKYGFYGTFGPSKDGQHVKIRPQAKKDRATPPRPSKYAPAMLLLQSIKDAGGSSLVDRAKTEGINVLAGLRVHVRRRKVSGQNENAKPVLLVDTIEAGGAPAAAKAPAAAAAKAAAPAVGNDEVRALAEQALLDLLGAQPEGKISRAKIATTLLHVEPWATHPQRPQIINVFKDSAFFTRPDAPWNVNGTEISL